LKHDPANDVLQIDGAVFVRFRYPAPQGMAIVYDFKMRDNRPEWTRDPPSELSGYVAAVGYAKQQRWLKDTMEKSYENAAAAMIAGMNTRVKSFSRVNEDTGGTTANSGTSQTSEGELVEFCVLETWMDPEDKSVWTLAVARPK
jgi:hypothetical protein